MAAQYSYRLRHDQQGRIIEKTETVAGKTVAWKYAYDKAGRLHEAYLGTRLVCQCHYDKHGRRSQDCFPASHGMQVRNYSYTMDDRLQSAGNNGYTHDRATGARSIWNNGGRYTTYQYAPDGRLLRAEQEFAGRVFQFDHDEEGRREAKYENGQMIEAYAWLDLVRLAGFHDGKSGYRFIYEDEARTPYAMQREDGGVFYLYFDQVDSLRVVADMQGDVIKETLYDPFGGIIEDTNPDLRIPIGFAGGLHDRDLGFVRFGWRDYDTYTSRWTAPDPMGDGGGDPDWYAYCLGDPVNLNDPFGLMGSKPGLPDESGMLKQYWRLKAEAGACDECQAMDGVVFMQKPGPVHPNCRCVAEEIWMTDEEAARYKNWKPPLLMPSDSPSGRAARNELKDNLTGFGESIIGLPDRVVTPIQWWGKHRKEEEKQE